MQSSFLYYLTRPPLQTDLVHFKTKKDCRLSVLKKLVVLIIAAHMSSFSWRLKFIYQAFVTHYRHSNSMRIRIT